MPPLDSPTCATRCWVRRRRLPDRWVAVGVGADDAIIGPDAVGTFAGYGVDVRVALAPGACGPAIRPSACALITGWVRGRVSPVRVPRSGSAPTITASMSRWRCGRALRAEIDADAADVGVLVVADGAHTLSPLRRAASTPIRCPSRPRSTTRWLPATSQHWPRCLPASSVGSPTKCWPDWPNRRRRRRGNLSRRHRTGSGTSSASGSHEWEYGLSRSSGPPAPGSPRWRSTWRSGSAARSSTPTPCSSIGAWTSAPRSCRSPNVAASRTTNSTCSTSRRPRPWPVTSRRRPPTSRRSPRGSGAGLVGGSMLYVQSLLDDWAFPATDPAVRARWENRLAEVGVSALHDELAGVDAAAAASILPTDGRRIVRALEVVELTGLPFAASAPTIGAPRWDTVIIGLDWETGLLDERWRAHRDDVRDGLGRRGHRADRQGTARRRHGIACTGLRAGARGARRGR